MRWGYYLYFMEVDLCRSNTFTNEVVDVRAGFSPCLTNSGTCDNHPKLPPVTEPH